MSKTTSSTFSFFFLLYIFFILSFWEERIENIPIASSFFCLLFFLLKISNLFIALGHIDASANGIGMKYHQILSFTSKTKSTGKTAQEKNGIIYSEKVMAREQTLTIKINGIEESIKNLKTIKDAIDVVQKTIPSHMDLTQVFKGVTETSTEMTDKVTGDIIKIQTLMTEVSSQELKIGPKVDPEAKKEVEKAVEGYEEQFKKTAKKLSAELTEFWGNFNAGISMGFKALTTYLASEKEETETHLKAITALHAKAVEERKKSTEAIDALENKSKNARGGRSIALQEQINAEMVNNQKLAAQEAKLAKDKEKAEKEKAKIEKKEKKQKLAQGIIESYASIAQGVAKALSMGFIGIPIAALIGAAGAAQIAVQVKQMSKLADGGMLRGKRHREGGMRIEGTNIEVEGGEYVINRQSTDRNLGLIRYINSERRQLSQNDINSFFSKTARGYEPAFRRSFAEGGQMPIVTETPSADNEQLLEAIRNIKFEPKVAVTDIVRAQESMTSVDSWVGI